MAAALPALDVIVDAFWAARRRGVHFPPEYSQRLTLDQSYPIQLALVERRCVGGLRRVGWKVGLTADVIQRQFSVFEPVFGCLLSEGYCESGHVFRHAALIEPGFETEVCLRLDRDVEGGASVDAVAAAVGACHPALEVVETRGDFTRDLPLAMADNAQQKAFVVGPGRPLGRPQDLAETVVSIRIDGREVATGNGRAVLGNPLNSVTWLAGKLAQFGRRLRAGDYVMTGSFARQFPIAAGNRIEAAFDPLGTVTASFV
jgi:2-keto-4-pentenoate hydratase